MYYPGDTSTENDIFCSTTECGNDTWIFNGTYNASWPNYEFECVFETRSQNFSASSIFHTCVYIMYGVIFIVALSGNGLVCLVFRKTPCMKTVTNYFIVNLAVGDILMTIFCVPFSFVSMLILRYWPFGGVMCKIVNYSQAVSVLVSAYTLLAISIDRYMAITQPLKPRLEKNAAKMVVAAVWCGALFTAAPIPIVSQLHRPSLWHEVCKADICSEQWASAVQSQQYTCALLTLQFVLPLCALVFTYARIACVVWRVRPPGEAESARDLRMHSSKRKMVKMMVTVVVVFTFCWLPLNIFIILWNIYSKEISWVTWPGMPYAWFMCHWLAMSHSCYNPIIYCYMNSRYRRGFKQPSMLTKCELAIFTKMCMYLLKVFMLFSVLEVIESLLGKKLSESGRICHRSSMCDGVPLSEIGINIGVRKPKSASNNHLNNTKCSRCSMKQVKTSPATNNSRSVVPPSPDAI